MAKRLDDVGLDALGEAHPALLVRPRLVDVGAAVNRPRSLQVNPGASSGAPGLQCGA